MHYRALPVQRINRLCALPWITVHYCALPYCTGLPCTAAHCHGLLCITITHAELSKSDKMSDQVNSGLTLVILGRTCFWWFFCPLFTLILKSITCTFKINAGATHLIRSLLGTTFRKSWHCNKVLGVCGVVGMAYVYLVALLKL